MRLPRVVIGVTAAAAVFGVAVVGWTGASAQEVDSEPEASETQDTQTDDSPIDEIEVVVGPQGQSVFDLELQRQAQLREAVFADLRLREIEEERLAWRREDPDLQNTESRIKWGYSPQAEQRMRRGNEKLHELDIDRDKPASIFRIEF